MRGFLTNFCQNLLTDPDFPIFATPASSDFVRILDEPSHAFDLRINCAFQ